MKVLIVRDREGAGGGIYNYYRAVEPHLQVQCKFVGVGRTHARFGKKAPFLRRVTLFRLLADWTNMAWQMLVFRPDLVHINPGLDVTSFRALRRDAVNGWIAVISMRPVLVFWRGWDNSWCGNREFPGGSNGWTCRIYKKAAAQVVLASRFKEDLRRWGFAMPIHIETTVASDECVGVAVRTEEHGDAINLLFLSRIEASKGIFELLEAYRILRERDPRYTLTFAGDGSDLESLKRRAAEKGLRHVVFTGFVRGEAKVNCFRNATIFCFPSSHGEGMPNAVLEAMAAGLPIVASDVGGLRDILEEGKTGILLRLQENKPRSRFDPEEIADAIERLARKPELREQISTYNVTCARKRFSARVVARRLETIYESLVQGGKVSGGDMRGTGGTIGHRAEQHPEQNLG